MSEEKRERCPRCGLPVVNYDEALFHCDGCGFVKKSEGIKARHSPTEQDPVGEILKIRGLAAKYGDGGERSSVFAAIYNLTTSLLATGPKDAEGVAEVYASRPDNGVPKIAWLPGVELPKKGTKLCLHPQAPEPEQGEREKVGGAWRPLDVGELVEEGDEVDAAPGLDDKPQWEPAKRIGEAAPDPKFPAHRTYRRPLATSTGTAMREREVLRELNRYQLVIESALRNRERPLSGARRAHLDEQYEAVMDAFKRSNELLATPQSGEMEEEERCERCFALEAHFELAEDFTEVAHTHMADCTGGFCLICGNHHAHPWHQEVPPSLRGLKDIKKYLEEMGFKMVRKDAGEMERDHQAMEKLRAMNIEWEFNGTSLHGLKRLFGPKRLPSDPADAILSGEEGEAP